MRFTPVVDAEFAVSLEAFIPEARAMNEKLLATPRPPATNLVEMRRALAEGGSFFPAPVRLPNALERDIPGFADGQTGHVRILVPDSVHGAYLYIHGGGFAMGARDHHDVRLWDLAQAAHVAVVSVGYRLAPEHPYPAGPDDCEAAAVWLVENAKSEFGIDRLTIGGGSAGGHLAAATLLRLRDRHQMSDRFCGADLLFGVYDLSLTPSQRNSGRRPIMGGEGLEHMSQQFVSGASREERRMNPDISPLYAELHDMPPALFSVGTLDPLLDDSLFMAARWAAAGNYAALDVYPESPHGFTMVPTAMARAYHERQSSFIAAAVAGDLMGMGR